MSDLSPFGHLQRAARDGDLLRVRELLEQGVDPNSDPGMPHGWSPLMEAAWKGHDMVVELLVERGANVHREDGDGFTAITLAAKQRRWKIVELLAAHGADVHHMDASGVSAVRAAKQARKSALVERLLAPPRTTDDTAPTAAARRVPLLFYVHWNLDELAERVAPLREAGYEVVAHGTPGVAPPFPKDPLPDAVVLSLDRLPSHGKAIADWVVEGEARRGIPLIFEGGMEEKVAPFRERFPGAQFVGTGEVGETLGRLGVAPES